MLDHVPLLPPPLFLLHHVRLRLLLDKLRHPTRFRYAFHLRKVRVLLYQRIPIPERGLLPRRQLSYPFGGSGLPQPYVGIVRSAQDILMIGTVSHAEHALHTFRVIHVSGHARSVGMGCRASLLPDGKNAYCLVVAAGDEFGPRGTPAEAHDRSHVTFVNTRWPIQLAHVERVRVVILVARGEHVRFHGIPLQAVGPHAHDCLF
mmetsp:Transcript_20151/g.48411  ORF Transcript_20151/g.48411 Transcript_20151/m.48411 type:complete len:204 (-) Transcript_20151:373-984(-)